MKTWEKFVVTAAVVLAVGGTTVTALAAAQHKTPAAFLAGLSGSGSAQSVAIERGETGRAYGTRAGASGTGQGIMAQERAEARQADCDGSCDAIAGSGAQERSAEALRTRQADCDGTCDAAAGAATGAGYGTRDGTGYGSRDGMGYGQGNRAGNR